MRRQVSFIMDRVQIGESRDDVGRRLIEEILDDVAVTVGSPLQSTTLNGEFETDVDEPLAIYVDVDVPEKRV